jgi:L-tyrosine isonitrile synthase
MSSEVICIDGSVAALSSMPNTQSRHSSTSFGQEVLRKASLAIKRADPKARTNPAPNIDALAEKVLRSFNTWAFKREQPSDPGLMLRFIGEAIAHSEPIPFVLYWGKGPRHQAAAPESQCLDFLSAMASRIADVYAPGAALKLIMTDSHAKLNGHSEADIRRYFDEIRSLADLHTIDACLMSEVVEAAGDAVAEPPCDQPVAAESLVSLIASAGKWYRGSGSIEEGAKKYFRMNMRERQAVQIVFPRSIFVTFNGSGLRGLFPTELPIFYMYSLRRGFAVKPWFLPAEPARPDVTDDRENSLQNA